MSYRSSSYRWLSKKQRLTSSFSGGAIPGSVGAARRGMLPSDRSHRQVTAGDPGRGRKASTRFP
jgi:hypothetical protein